MQNWNQWQVPAGAVTAGAVTAPMPPTPAGYTASGADPMAMMQSYMQYFNQPAPSGYTNEQWATAQQQNWTQWQQWQQQFQQWQAQYGEKYQETMKNLSSQGLTLPNVSQVPPLPIAQPPPLPKEESKKPPLPPDNTPFPFANMPPPNQNNLPLFPSKSGEAYNSKTDGYYPQPPPPPPNQPPLPTPSPQEAQHANLPREKRANNEPVQFGSAKKTKVEDEDLTEAEKTFDAQFKQWEEEFNKWKQKNANHPDKTQYKQYESEWTSWREKLIERREQMRKKREQQKQAAKAETERSKNIPGGDKILNLLSSTENQGLLDNLLGIGKTLGLSAKQEQAGPSTSSSNVSANVGGNAGPKTRMQPAAMVPPIMTNTMTQAAWAAQQWAAQYSASMTASTFPGYQFPVGVMPSAIPTQQTSPVVNNFTQMPPSTPTSGVNFSQPPPGFGIMDNLKSTDRGMTQSTVNLHDRPPPNFGSNDKGNDLLRTDNMTLGSSHFNQDLNSPLSNLRTGGFSPKNDTFGRDRQKNDQGSMDRGGIGQFGVGNDRLTRSNDRFSLGNDRFSQGGERFGFDRPRNDFGSGDRAGSSNQYTPDSDTYLGRNDRLRQDNDRFGGGGDRLSGNNRFSRDNDNYKLDSERFDTDHRGLSDNKRSGFESNAFGSERNERFHADDDRFSSDSDRFRLSSGNDRFSLGNNDRLSLGSDRFGSRNDNLSRSDRFGSGNDRLGFGKDQMGSNSDRGGTVNEKFGTGSLRFGSNLNKDEFNQNHRFGNDNFSPGNDRFGRGDHFDRNNLDRFDSKDMNYPNDSRRDSFGDNSRGSNRSTRQFDVSSEMSPELKKLMEKRRIALNVFKPRDEPFSTNRQASIGSLSESFKKITGDLPYRSRSPVDLQQKSLLGSGPRHSDSLLSRGSDSLLSRGPGDFGSRGSDSLLSRGSGDYGPRGSDSLLSRGPGDFGPRGSDSLLTRGPGDFGPRGSDSLLSRGPGDLGPRGSDSLLSRGPGDLAPRGSDSLLSRGPGDIGPRGSDSLLSRGPGDLGPRGSDSLLARGPGDLGPRGSDSLLSRGPGDLGPRGSDSLLPRGLGDLGPRGTDSLLSRGPGELGPRGSDGLLSRGPGDLGARGSDSLLARGPGDLAPRGSDNLLSRGSGDFGPRGSDSLLSRGSGDFGPRGADSLLSRGPGDFGPRGSDNLMSRSPGEFGPRGSDNLMSRSPGDFGFRGSRPLDGFVPRGPGEFNSRTQGASNNNNFNQAGPKGMEFAPMGPSDRFRARSDFGGPGNEFAPPRCPDTFGPSRPEVSDPPGPTGSTGVPEQRQSAIPTEKPPEVNNQDRDKSVTNTEQQQASPGLAKQTEEHDTEKPQQAEESNTDKSQMIMPLERPSWMSAQFSQEMTPQTDGVMNNETNQPTDTNAMDKSDNVPILDISADDTHREKNDDKSLIDETTVENKSNPTPDAAQPDANKTDLPFMGENDPKPEDLNMEPPPKLPNLGPITETSTTDPAFGSNPPAGNSMPDKFGPTESLPGQITPNVPFFGPRGPTDMLFRPRGPMDGNFGPRGPPNRFQFRGPIDNQFGPGNSNFNQNRSLFDAPFKPREPDDRQFGPRGPNEAPFRFRGPNDGSFGPRGPNDGSFGPRGPNNGPFGPRGPGDGPFGFRGPNPFGSRENQFNSFNSQNQREGLLGARPMDGPFNPMGGGMFGPRGQFGNRGPNPQSFPMGRGPIEPPKSQIPSLLGLQLTAPPNFDVPSGTKNKFAPHEPNPANQQDQRPQSGPNVGPNDVDGAMDSSDKRSRNSPFVPERMGPSDAGPEVPSTSEPKLGEPKPPAAGLAGSMDQSAANNRDAIINFECTRRGSDQRPPLVEPRQGNNDPSNKLNDSGPFEAPLFNRCRGKDDRQGFSGLSSGEEFRAEKQFNYNHGGGVIDRSTNDTTPVEVIDYAHASKSVVRDYAISVQSFDYGHGNLKPVVPEHELIPRRDFQDWEDTEQNLKEYDDRMRIYEDDDNRQSRMQLRFSSKLEKIHSRDSLWDNIEMRPFDRNDRRSFDRDSRGRRDREKDRERDRRDDRNRRNDRDRNEDRDRRDDRDRESGRDFYRDAVAQKDGNDNRDRNRERSERNRMDQNRENNRDVDRSKGNLSQQESLNKSIANSAVPEPSQSDVNHESLETVSKKMELPKSPSFTMVDDILCKPGRQTRPPKIVIILRGPPGSGKSFVAKLIKDREVEQGGSAPRILSLDDYFLVEKEIESQDDNGKKIKTKEMVYEYEEAMEQSYLMSLVKAFKKNITDGYFNFIILDCVNEKISDYEDMWSFAKTKGFQVYVCEMEMDVQICLKRNIHNRTEEEVNRIVDYFEPTPNHHLKLDVTSMLQEEAIDEVHMEDSVPTPEKAASQGNEDSQDSQDEPVGVSKWERMDAENKLDRLDGLAKRKNEGRPQTMEDFLQVPDYYNMEDDSGKKRVRWADLEEKKEQEKMRAVGFVVGHTNWDRMMDPTKGQSALTRTKASPLS